MWNFWNLQTFLVECENVISDVLFSAWLLRYTLHACICLSLQTCHSALCIHSATLRKKGRGFPSFRTMKQNRFSASVDYDSYQYDPPTGACLVSSPAELLMDDASEVGIPGMEVEVSEVKLTVWSAWVSHVTPNEIMKMWSSCSGVLLIQIYMKFSSLKLWEVRINPSDYTVGLVVFQSWMVFIIK